MNRGVLPVFQTPSFAAPKSATDHLAGKPPRLDRGGARAPALSPCQVKLAIMEGPAALLDALQRHGIHFCVASGGSPERIAFALSCLGLTERFANMAFSAESVPRGKPAPDLFLHAAGQTGHSVGDCVVIEDAASGAEAARAAGIPCIGFLGGSPLDGNRDRQRRILSDNGVTSFTGSHRELQALLVGQT